MAFSVETFLSPLVQLYISAHAPFNCSRTRLPEGWICAALKAFICLRELLQLDACLCFQSPSHRTRRPFNRPVSNSLQDRCGCQGKCRPGASGSCEAGGGWQGKRPPPPQ